MVEVVPMEVEEGLVVVGDIQGEHQVTIIQIPVEEEVVHTMELFKILSKLLHTMAFTAMSKSIEFPDLFSKNFAQLIFL